MKLLCSFVVFIIIFENCLVLSYSSRTTRSRDRSRHRETSRDRSEDRETSRDRSEDRGTNRDRFGHREKSHGHLLHKSLVKMPSGKMKSITTPYKCSLFQCGDHAKQILLNPHGKMAKHEYNAVKREILAGATTDVQYKISKIVKIINPCLWSKYWYRQQQVKVEANETNEMMLFHSSSTNKQNIDSGFDERYSRLGPYGAGLYFTNNPSKVHEFSKPKSDGTRTMLLCRVTLGKSSEIAPTKLAHAPVGYQSVKEQGTEDYVIYRGEQAYPEYLITYRI